MEDRENYLSLAMKALRMGDESDPHENCQDCFYNYPYVLRRVLSSEVLIQSSSDREGVLSIAGSSGGMPRPNSVEASWKDALLHKNLPSMKIVKEELPTRPFPTLLYLSALSIWESIRDEKDLEQKIESLPISPPLKKYIFDFIKNENASMKKHYKLKIQQLLFSTDFLFSL